MTFRLHKRFFERKKSCRLSQIQLHLSLSGYCLLPLHRHVSELAWKFGGLWLLVAFLSWSLWSQGAYLLLVWDSQIAEFVGSGGGVGGWGGGGQRRNFCRCVKGTNRCTVALSTSTKENAALCPNRKVFFCQHARVCLTGLSSLTGVPLAFPAWLVIPAF